MQELPIEGRKKERKEGKKEGGKEGRKEQRKEGGREWEKGEKATSLLYSIRFLCECVYFGLKCFLERIIISLSGERTLPPGAWCILPGPDRTILFLLDQYGPQSCSHCGFCSISVILRLTTHKCSEEEPIIPYSLWLVMATHNYWKRGVQSDPRDGTKRNGFFSSLQFQ